MIGGNGEEGSNNKNATITKTNEKNYGSIWGENMQYATIKLQNWLKHEVSPKGR
jgi:hypothetical protein